MADNNNWSFKLEKGQHITKVLVNHGDIVDGLGFEIVDKYGEVYEKWFTGPGGKRSEIVLNGGEFLTHISGSFGDYYGANFITTIMIHTNLNRDGYGPYGEANRATNVTPFSSPIPLDGSILEFFGSINGDYLSTIGIYQKGYMIKDYGPYGDKERKTNWYIELNEGQKISKVLINHGFIVDGVGFEVTRNLGSTNRLVVGGLGGDPSEINLGENEYITKLSGVYGKFFGKEIVIGSMIVHTNLRPNGYGPYGRAEQLTKAEPFSTPESLEGPIVGFNGSYGRYLNSIGIFEKYKKIVKYGPYGNENAY